MLEQCCTELRELLEEVSLSEPVDLPAMPCMTDDELYERFSQLVEFAYTGSADVAPEQCAAAWAVASRFGFHAFKVRLHE